SLDFGALLFAGRTISAGRGRIGGSGAGLDAGSGLERVVGTRHLEASQILKALGERDGCILAVAVRRRQDGSRRKTMEQADTESEGRVRRGLQPELLDVHDRA